MRVMRLRMTDDETIVEPDHELVVTLRSDAVLDGLVKGVDVPGNLAHVFYGPGGELEGGKCDGGDQFFHLKKAALREVSKRGGGGEKTLNFAPEAADVSFGARRVAAVSAGRRSVTAETRQPPISPGQAHSTPSATSP